MGEIYPESGPVPRSMNREEGYRVHYPDGYESWSPKGVFEQAHLPMTVNPDLRTDAPSISQQMVDDFILETWTQTMGDKTTVVRAMLRNGFEIMESSACVSAENYDEKNWAGKSAWARSRTRSGSCWASCCRPRYMA